MARRGQQRRKQSQPMALAGPGPVRASLDPLRLLSQDRVEAIHNASLRVLQETGIEILSGQARQLFRDAGAKVDETAERTRLAPDLIESSIATCPSDRTLHARSAARNVPLGGHFFADPLTLDRYQTAFWKPMLSDWSPYDGWADAGARDTTTRAGEIADRLLHDFQPPPMDAAIREELDAYIAKRKEALS